MAQSNLKQIHQEDYIFGAGKKTLVQLGPFNEVKNELSIGGIKNQMTGTINTLQFEQATILDNHMTQTKLSKASEIQLKARDSSSSNDSLSLWRSAIQEEPLNDFSTGFVNDIKKLIDYTINDIKNEVNFWSKFNDFKLSSYETEQLIQYINSLKIEDKSTQGFRLCLLGSLLQTIDIKQSADLFEQAAMLNHRMAMSMIKEMYENETAEINATCLNAIFQFEEMNETKLFSLKFDPELITENAQRTQRESVNKNCLKSAINGSLEKSNSSLPFFKFAHFGPEVQLPDIHTISPFTCQFKSNHTGILLIITSEDTDKESLKISSDNKKALLACSELPQLIAILKTIPNGKYLAETIEPFVDSNTNTL